MRLKMPVHCSCFELKSSCNLVIENCRKNWIAIILECKKMTTPFNCCISITSEFLLTTLPFKMCQCNLSKTSSHYFYPQFKWIFTLIQGNCFNSQRKIFYYKRKIKNKPSLGLNIYSQLSRCCKARESSF